MDLASFQAGIKRTVDQELARILGGCYGGNEPLHRAVQAAALGPGKRVRPALTAAAAAVFDCPTEPVLPAMCAVELIHCCSLVLDDLPCMDDAEFRHGQPPLHARFGEATAVLAAVALLNQAYAVLTDRSVEPALALRWHAEAVRAVGAGGLIGGQAAELTDRQCPDPGTALDDVLSRKCGALIVAAVRMGAFCGNATPSDVQRLTDYAGALGLAYQVCDDVLEATRAPGELGKASRKKNGKLDTVQALGLDGARERLERLTADAVAALAPFGARAECLATLARALGQRTR